MTEFIRVTLDVDVAIDSEENTVSISFLDIPLDYLELVLLNMTQPIWRQNILDGVRGAQAALGLGVEYTERSFNAFSEVEE